MNDNVTLIIPTMKRIKSLQDTLDSFFHGSIIPNQIIIIDQTPNEILRKSIRDLAISYGNRIEYYYQDTPSLTKARNYGFSLAKNEIIIMSDDDVIVRNDTVQNVVDIFRNSNISMIAGINSRDSISNSNLGCLFGKKSFLNRNIGHVSSAMYGRFPNQKVSGEVMTQWAMGFFFAIKRSLVKKWDLLWDEQLTSYAYAEDLDFSFSLYKKSKEENMYCVLSDRVVVEHCVSTEWRIPTRKTTMMLVLNREYLAYKHRIGLGGLFWVHWSNIGDIFFYLLKKISTKDMFDAIRVCRNHHNEIKHNILKAEWYDE